jgi:ornithine cyclodeaminase
MRIITAEDLGRAFTFPRLVDALRDAFRADVTVPVRHHHRMERPGEPDATLLLMPAWGSTASDDDYVGVKIVSLYPANRSRGLPSIFGSYLLMDGRSGNPLALIDGTALTLWRTAAASALAATYLARKDASRLVMLGAGSLAPYLIEAHASMRPISSIAIWNRNPERAAALAKSLSRRQYRVESVSDRGAAIREADIISSATMSSEPLVRGEWLKPGAHVDLVGAFTPAMRESDDEAVRRARIYVDTREAAMKEAGDILLPLGSGVISKDAVAGDLFGLCRGEVEGRRSDGEITLFKSVGTALEDLAAAALAYGVSGKQHR